MGKTKTVVISGEPEEKPKRKSEKKKGVKVPGLKGGERVKAVEAGPLAKEEKPSLSETKTKKRVKTKKRGSKYKKARLKIDKTKLYPLKKAIKLVKETSYSSFDGTVELHLVVKKEALSAKVTLPYSTGKTKKIEVVNEKTIEKLKKGKINFDILLATKEMMPKIVPFAKLLGPKGLMPNPKNGTLIKDLKEVKKFSQNTLHLKTEKKAPLIHTAVGKVSSKENELEENIKEIIGAIGKKQIIKAYLSPTMGPSVKIELA